jgi:hypothetical protein
MPTPLKLVRVVLDPVTNGWIDEATRERPAVGDCFYHAPILTEENEPILEKFSPAFIAAHGALGEGAAPRVVVLPSGQWWCIDERAYNRKQGRHGNGWTITGALPLITARPSINTTKYHGYLTDGVLSDDLGNHVADD